jgi:hypothetical protein
MTEDPSSLFAPRGDSISSDDPPSGPDRPAWRRVPPGADNPTGWRLAGLWALGSLVVAATGLVVAGLLGTGPPGMADGIQRVVVLPFGGRDAAEPAPPAVPVPGQQDPTARRGPVVPGQLPPESFPADPGYPVAPDIPLPGDPSTSSGTGSLPPPVGTSPVPTGPTPPAVPGPTTTVEPTAPAGEVTPPSQPTEPAGTPAPTTEPTTQAPVEPPPEDQPPADPAQPPGPGTPAPDDADRAPTPPAAI